MGKPKVVIMAGGRYETAIALLEALHYDVVLLRDVIDGKAFEELADADGLIYGVRPLPPEVFERAARLKVVALLAAGYDNVDLEAASRHGVYVANAPGANSDAVAEFTFGLILGLVRHICEASAYLRSGHWQKSDFVGVQLRGKILGVVGMGRIGQRVARLGRCFGMDILGVDPFVQEDVFRQEGIQRVPLDEVLPVSDILTIHASLVERSMKLIGSRELARMKPTACLINVGRGGLVDETALLDALDDGRLAGAALDVFEEEPLQNRRLLDHPRVLITPHIAGWNDVSRINIGKTAAEQVRLVLEGERPVHGLNDPPEPRNRFRS